MVQCLKCAQPVNVIAKWVGLHSAATVEKYLVCEICRARNFEAESERRDEIKKEIEAKRREIRDAAKAADAVERRKP